jgi:hypothetical protein
MLRIFWVLLMEVLRACFPRATVFTTSLDIKCSVLAFKAHIEGSHLSYGSFLRQDSKTRVAI